MERKYRSAGIIGASILGLALLAACTNDPEPGTEGNVTGVLRDDCGPADGPAIYMSMDRSKSLTCADPSPGEFKLSVDDRQVDSIKAGAVLMDTVSICNEAGCEPMSEYRIEVESVDAASVKGTVEVTEKAGGVSTKRRFKADLKKCPRPQMMCG